MQDRVPENIIPQKPRERNRRPTVRQIKAVKFISDGMSVRGALKKAGYSPGVYEASTAFFKHKGAKIALESQIAHLNRAGITQEKLANKLAEFIDATKIDHSHTGPDKEVPDYYTQIQGVKLADEMFQRSGQQGTKKREMTITEFITGEESA